MSAAPIQQAGFELPESSSASSTTGGMFSIDPSFVYGFEDSQRTSSTSAPPFGHGHATGISDLDLDFEATLASLRQHTVNGGETEVGGGPHEHHLNHHGHDFGAAGASYLNSASMNAFDLFGFSKMAPQPPQPLGSDPFSSSASTHPPPVDLATSLPHFLAHATSMASPASLAAMATIPAPQQQQQQQQQVPTPGSVHSPSQHDLGKQSPGLPQAIDLFGGQPTPSSQHESPREFGSFSSVGTDSLPSLATTAATSQGSSGGRGRKQSPPEQPVERGRATSRRRSDHVGKAPSNSARSRSARRQAAQYQSMGTGGAAAQASAAAAAAAQREASASSPAAATKPIPSSPAAAAAVSIPTHQNSNASSSNNPGWLGSQQPAYSQTSEYDSGSLESSGWGQDLSASKKGKQLDDVPEDPKQAAALLTEKRRKRRESHNAVERRRRDNINDRITELASLLPEVLLEQAANTKEDDFLNGGSPSAGLSAILSPSPNLLNLPALGTSPQSTAYFGSHMAQGAGAQAVAAAKPNKGVILAKSVEYIRYLQQLVELQAQRSSQLEQMVTELRRSSQPSQAGHFNSHPQRTDSTNSFDSGISNSGPGTGGSTSDARSPTDTRDMTASISSSHFGDPNFNENFINAAGQDYSAESPWVKLGALKQEDMDQS